MNNVLNSLMTDSTDIAFDLVNERVNSLFESAPKPKAHSSNHVNKKTSKNGQKFPYLKKIKRLSAIKDARSRETSFNQCLGPPGVQMSILCRHTESYRHKDASRQRY